jgi:phospholipid-translocating ATPase
MLLWVVIYSYLPASDNFFSATDSFVDEVEVLFSNVTFWSTVVFSVMVALGEWQHQRASLGHGSDRFSSAPRFLYKFASSAYAPLDKDIVREMWVSGDLKDRLGIRHRNASKNARVSDLETAPMFREPHARSASELTLSHAYEPTRVSPESSDANEKRRAGYPDDVLEVERTMPPLIPVGSAEMVDVRAEQRAVGAVVSPHASYYSSNDIPIPSPIPPSLYRFPNGEIGERERERLSRGTSPTSTLPLPEGYPRSPGASSMGMSSPPESIEMQVRHLPTQSLSAYSAGGHFPDDASRPPSWMVPRAV